MAVLACLPPDLLVALVEGRYARSAVLHTHRRWEAAGGEGVQMHQELFRNLRSHGCSS